MPSPQSRVLRLTQALDERLTAYAGERGVSRPRAVALLLDEQGGAAGVDEPTHDEAIWLLAQMARAGRVSAAIAYERALRPDDEEPASTEVDPLAELDELAQRRKGGVG